MKKKSLLTPIDSRSSYNESIIVNIKCTAWMIFNYLKKISPLAKYPRKIMTSTIYSMSNSITTIIHSKCYTIATSPCPQVLHSS